MLLRIAIVLIGTAWAACGGAKGAYEDGERAARQNDWEQAIAFYERAVRESPASVEYRIALRRAYEEAARFHLAEARDHLAAGNLARAAVELELALRYEPTRPYALEQLEEVRRLLAEEDEAAAPLVRERLFGPEPVLDPASSEPIHLKFAEQTSLRTILETLGKLAGVNVLFDESFRDRRVTVELDGVTFEQALELLLSTHGLYYKVLSSSAVRIAPGNP